MMNNKLIWVLLGILIATIAKLSMDVYYTYPRTVQALNLALDQQNQRIGSLNDQLIVVQRGVENTAQPTISNKETLSLSVEKTELIYNKEDYVNDYIELIQFNIQQQQLDKALENIQNLKQKLITQPLLNESFNLALLEALQQDQKNLQLYIKQRAEHLFVLQQQLTALEKLLQPAPLDKPEQKWDFKNWFSISKADDIPNLENHYLQYRYLQLKVLLAQQSLLAGQIDLYDRQMKDIKAQIIVYPNADAKKIIQQLQNMETMTLNAPPQMTAMTLVRGD